MCPVVVTLCLIVILLLCLVIGLISSCCCCRDPLPKWRLVVDRFLIDEEEPTGGVDAGRVGAATASTRKRSGGATWPKSRIPTTNLVDVVCDGRDVIDRKELTDISSSTDDDVFDGGPRRRYVFRVVFEFRDKPGAGCKRSAAAGAAAPADSKVDANDDECCCFCDCESSSDAEAEETRRPAAADPAGIEDEDEPSAAAPEVCPSAVVDARRVAADDDNDLVDSRATQASNDRRRGVRYSPTSAATLEADAEAVLDSVFNWPFIFCSKCCVARTCRQRTGLAAGAAPTTTSTE